MKRFATRILPTAVALAAVTVTVVLSPTVAGDSPPPLLTAPISKTVTERFVVQGLDAVPPGDVGDPQLLGTGIDIRTTFSNPPQNETCIAGDPNNANILVGGMNDYSVLVTGFAGNGVVYSNDGGATWTHSAVGVPLPAAFPDRGGDPVLEFDTQGRVFYGSLGLRGLGSPFFSDNGIFVGRSDDGGVTWNPMVGVATNVGGGALVNFEDKPFITVDQSPASPFTDRVYISWTRFYSGNHPDGGVGGGDIMVSRSSDGGATWTTQRLVLPGNGGTGGIGSSFVQGSEPEVAPNGDVYVTFWFGGRIEVWRSTNGGVTYSQRTQPFGLAFGNIVVPSPLPNESFRCNAFPNIETHPFKPGHVYVNVAGDPTASFGDGDDADIFFARSTDGGTTWGPQLTLNDDGFGKNQIFPWMAVSAKGAIHVIWYDTRNDAGNHDIDVFGAYSVDGGATFLPNFRVTDCNFDPDTGQFGGNSFFGDYNGLASNGTNTFHALWTDTRLTGCPQVGGGEQEIFYDQIQCEVASLTCPPDSFLPAFTNLPKYVLDGFEVTNVSNAAMAYTYHLSTVGPGTLDDCGDSTSVWGCTPLLNPGDSFVPPNAGIIFPGIFEPDTQKVYYVVSPKNNDCWSDTCCTVITLEPAVPVAFVSFEAHGTANGVDLYWGVIDAVDVLGYNVYRSDDAGLSYRRISGALPATASSYFDRDVIAGRDYTYKIGAMDREGEILSIPRSASVAVALARLGQNTPNPFNPVTSITFVLPESQLARVSIYDTQGKLVTTLFDGKGVPGENHVTWDGTNAVGVKVSSGVYYYRLTAGKFHQTRKMVLLK